MNKCGNSCLFLIATVFFRKFYGSMGNLQGVHHTGILKIIRHKTGYIGNFTGIKTVFVYGGTYWLGMFGAYLGWMNIGLPWAVLYTLMAVLLYVSVKDNGIAKPTWGERILPLLCAAAVAGLTFASVYAQFTPLGGELVIGIQGRYFLPLVTAAVLGLKAWAPERKETARLACPLAALAAASLAGVLCVFIQSY